MKEVRGAEERLVTKRTSRGDGRILAVFDHFQGKQTTTTVYAYGGNKKT